MEDKAENNRREHLFHYLDFILEFSQKKFKSHHIRSREKLGWGRLMVTAISTYGTLVKDSELDQLREEIEKIKEKLPDVL